MPCCQRASAASLILAGLVLTGCTSLPPGINPVTWWHDLEGGAVAAQRPPPPNADAPYPNLATVPPKPTPPDPAIRARIASALVADRANAQYAASQAPLPDPSSRAASPGLFGGAVPPPPPADPDASSASMPGASAPPRPATMPFKPAPPPAPVPAPGPRVGVSATPLAPPEAPPLTPAAAPAVAPGTPPVIPAAPPPAPNLPGVSIPVTAPAPPPSAPAAPPPLPRTATAEDRVPVAFAPGSAVLPPGTDGVLRHLITIGKGARGIGITGYGEAGSTSPEAQAAGVRLGLLRAQAIAAVFAAVGMKAESLHLDAQAAGTGGEARVLN